MFSIRGFHRVYINLIIVVISVGFLQKVNCDGILQMKLVSFSNPGGKGSNGHCCDGKWSFCESRGGCDHFFQICIDNAQGSDSISVCAMGTKTTGTIHNQAYINFGSTIGSTPNPMDFPFSSWQDEAVIKVDVWDDDDRNDDFVDFLKTTIPLSASRSASAAGWSAVSLTARTTLELEMRVFCSVDWYGSRCHVFCRPRRGPTAFYTCNSNNGSKVCDEGWTGVNCDQNIDDCIGSPCLNEGSCQDDVGGYTCTCHQGYTGNQCETDIDDCVGVNCHQGDCVDGANGYTCRCHNGSTGEACDEVDFCQQNPCSNDGICQTSLNSFNCTCNSGWTGNHCEVDIDECDNSSPCRNILDCVNSDGSFECVCLPGWTGQLCDVNVDECQSNPCINNGTCVDKIDGYVCQCVDGWGFSDCNVPLVKGCDEGLCKNNGSCVETDGDYVQCLCPRGWTGVYCEEWVSDLCSANPCLHDGTCVSPIGKPDQLHCICPDGYVGTFCGEIIRPEQDEKVVPQLIDDDNDDDDDDGDNHAGSEYSVLVFEDRTAQDWDSMLREVFDEILPSFEKKLPGDSTSNLTSFHYKIRECQSALSVPLGLVFFRVKIREMWLPRKEIDRVLEKLVNKNFRFDPDKLNISGSTDCPTIEMEVSAFHASENDHHYYWPIIVGLVAGLLILVAIVVAKVAVKRRKHKRIWEVSDPIYIPATDEEPQQEEEGCNDFGPTRLTLDRDSQRIQSNTYMFPNQGYGESVTCHQPTTTIFP